MKTQKGFAVLATLSVLALSVACSDRYDEGVTAGREQGYKEGYDVGYDDGYADGDEAGYARAKELFMSADYKTGYSDGQTNGYNIGYSNGVSVGRTEGQTIGYSQGYNQGKTDGKNETYKQGYDAGYDDGYDDGYATVDTGAYRRGETAGYTAGYDVGYTDGDADGYDRGYDHGYDEGETVGYTDGYDDGYDLGYDDGYDDGYGLSVGKTKPQRGYANILSMAHNDLFDYSKIKAPQTTKRGLVANGRLLLSETSLTNKDTLKRAAVVEQYLVFEMAKQVKGKLGLSAERSLQIAKAANHFRKYTTKRALTAEDTNAYAAEIIGSELRDIERAIDSAKSGDLSKINSVLDKAAEKNSTTPENMAVILKTHFI